MRQFPCSLPNLHTSQRSAATTPGPPRPWPSPPTLRPHCCSWRAISISVAPPAATARASLPSSLYELTPSSTARSMSSSICSQAGRGAGQAGRGGSSGSGE